MKLVIILMTACFTAQAIASVAYISRAQYRCSDGQEYDVARLYIGGYSPEGRWSLVAFCSKNTLQSSEYSGRIMNEEGVPRGVSNDLDRCLDEDTPVIRNCYNEFIDENGDYGISNGMPEIVHAPVATASPNCTHLIEQARQNYYNQVRECNQSSGNTSPSTIRE